MIVGDSMFARCRLRGAVRRAPASGRQHRARRGVTLIELMVALAITMIMMTAVITLFANVSGTVSNSRAWSKSPSGCGRCPQSLAARSGRPHRQHAAAAASRRRRRLFGDHRRAEHRRGRYDLRSVGAAHTELARSPTPIIGIRQQRKPRRSPASRRPTTSWAMPTTS